MASKRSIPRPLGPCLLRVRRTSHSALVALRSCTARRAGCSHGPVETDDTLEVLVAKLQDLGSRRFTADALRSPGFDDENIQRICAHLQAFGLIDAAGSGRWRVNAEKLDEARAYLHLKSVAGGTVTDDVFDGLHRPHRRRRTALLSQPRQVRAQELTALTEVAWQSQFLDGAP